MLRLANDKSKISLVVSQLHVRPQHPTAIQVCIHWIIEKTLSVERHQLLFLCATLGYIVSMKKSHYLPLKKDERTKQACDKLLENLANCAKKGFQIPRDCVDLVKESAFSLVQGSSNPGWLTFAAYFTRFFGMYYVLHFVNMEPWEYSKKDFMTLFSVMLIDMPSVKKVDPAQKALYKPFLIRVLQFVGKDDDLFQMYQQQDVFRFFHSPNQREHFFIELYEARLSSLKDLGEILKYLKRFPAKLRPKMSGIIYAYVQHFITTVAEPSPYNVEVIFDLISHGLSDDNVKSLLTNLSKSSSAFHHDLFIRLLNQEKFATKWANVPRSEKLKTCNAWMETKINFDSSGRIKGTFEALDILISCTHISSNKNLIQRLCGSAIDNLHREEPIRIIEESNEIEKLSSSLESYFQELVQVTLDRNPRLLKDKKLTTSLCGNIR